MRTPRFPQIVFKSRLSARGIESSLYSIMDELFLQSPLSILTDEATSMYCQSHQGCSGDEGDSIETKVDVL
jgi:hypothetical protein